MLIKIKPSCLRDSKEENANSSRHPILPYSYYKKTEHREVKYVTSYSYRSVSIGFRVAVLYKCQLTVAAEINTMQAAAIKKIHKLK